MFGNTNVKLMNASEMFFSQSKKLNDTKIDFNQLSNIYIKDLKTGINKNTYIELYAITNPCYGGGINIIVEDKNKDYLMLAL